MKNLKLRFSCMLFFCATLLTSSIAGFSPFCQGYEDGYKHGYNQNKPNSNPFIPFCPTHSHKYSSNPEEAYHEGYIKGYKKGLYESR